MVGQIDDERLDIAICNRAISIEVAEFHKRGVVVRCNATFRFIGLQIN